MKVLDPASPRVRFGIATDEPISGAGLHGVLRERERFRVVWLPGSMDRLRKAVQVLPIDLILIDMACGFPADVDRQLRESGWTAPIILWTRDIVTEPVDARSTVLDKRSAPDTLLACIETVWSGANWGEAQLAAPHGMPKPDVVPVRISPREADLMNLVADGLSNRQIAARLQLTEGSVKVYFSRLFRKLGIADRVGLALYSMRQPWEGGTTRTGLNSRRSNPSGN